MRLLTTILASIATLLAIIVLVFVAGPALYRLFGFPADDTEALFGAMSALVAALAFAALIVSIRLQQKELALTRQELRDTRKELQGSKLAQQAQVDAMNEQVQWMKTQTEALQVQASIRQSEHEAEIEKSYPRLKFAGGTGIGKRGHLTGWRSEVKNIGGAAREFQVRGVPEEYRVALQMRALEAGDKGAIDVFIPEESGSGSFQFGVYCRFGGQNWVTIPCSFQWPGWRIRIGDPQPSEDPPA